MWTVAYSQTHTDAGMVAATRVGDGLEVEYEGERQPDPVTGLIEKCQHVSNNPRLFSATFTFTSQESSREKLFLLQETPMCIQCVRSHSPFDAQVGLLILMEDKIEKDPGIYRREREERGHLGDVNP